MTARTVQEALSLLLTFPLLIVCCFAPGFFFVRRLHWSPMEKLCGSVGLSLILVYLASWGFYWFAPSVEVTAFYGVSIICAVLAVLCAKDILRSIRSFRVCHALFGF